MVVSACVAGFATSKQPKWARCAARRNAGLVWAPHTESSGPWLNGPVIAFRFGCVSRKQTGLSYTGQHATGSACFSRPTPAIAAEAKALASNLWREDSSDSCWIRACVRLVWRRS